MKDLNFTPDNQWLIGTIITTAGIIFSIILSIIGWIYVHYSNLKNTKKEKEISIKLQGYDSLSIIINDTIIKFSDLSSNLTLLKSDLILYYEGQDNIFLKRYREKLLTQFRENKIFELFHDASGSFLRLIFIWERFELIFKNLVKQRFALQEYHYFISSEFTKIYDHYTRTLLTLEYNNNFEPKDLINSIQAFYEHTIDFSCCITDVNHNLQNFVYGDIFESKLNKRKVANDSIPTIDSLMLKFKEKIEKDYF